ncbi:MAG: nitrogen fixation protein NifQ [Coriobacteriia bacterium]|nr:nitrogen fixation protein NifQ [Coriobacteriia bacterium]
MAFERTQPDLDAAVADLLGPEGPESRFAAQVAERRVEFDALVELLERDATPGVDSDDRHRIARAVAAGCLGEQHLWRDLALERRGVLRALLEEYFEPLAADNVMDMRWKKFIYRRLCRWGGFATCKSPSCGVCPDYSECFGPE